MSDRPWSMLFLHMGRMASICLAIPYNTQGDTPPRATFEATFLDNGERANAERHAYGKISTKYS